MAIYFEWAWLSYPFVFMAFFLSVESLGKKLLGASSATAVLFGVFGVVALVIIKSVAPQDLYTWEDATGPLKWILP